MKTIYLLRHRIHNDLASGEKCYDGQCQKLFSDRKRLRMRISVGPYLSGWCLRYLEMHAELNAFYGSHIEREKAVCFVR